MRVSVVAGVVVLMTWLATPETGAVPGVVQCAAIAPAALSSGGVLRQDTCYRVRGPLAVTGGRLMVEPGVRVVFEPNGSLSISATGSMRAIGTPEKPIVFTSADPAGRWRGVRFDGSRSPDNALHHVTIENGGSAGWSGAAHSAAGLALEGNTLVDIQHSTIAGSGAQGILAEGDVEMTFEHSTLARNTVAAWVHPNAAGGMGASTRFDGNIANVVRVGFGNTDAVTRAQTWHTLEVPYEIRDRTWIDAPLALDPGVVLAFVADASMIVRTDGSLSAVGTAAAPIVFRGVENVAGSWKGLQITTASTSNRFDHVIFEGGGSQAWTGAPDSRAMVYLDGNSRARFTNTTFRGSAHYALWVPDEGNIDGFEGNTFTANRRTMIVHPNRAGQIAATNVFRDNRENKVRVSFGNTDAVIDAQVWQDVGAPYYITMRTFVRGDLTIAAGAEVEFAQDASLVVTADGSLRAAGTAESPIVLRGGEDLPGYWQGIEYGTVSTANLLAHVVLTNAGSRPWFGGPNSTSALHVAPTGFVALENVTFAHSVGYAVIVRRGGRLTCTVVDHGGLQFFASATGTALPVCPR